MNKLVLSNLIHRPLRSLISIVSIAAEVILILIIVGLLMGILNDNRQRQAGIGADAMVRPPGSSFISGVSGAPISIKVGDVLRKVPHVVAVAPVATQLTTEAVEVVYGIDLPSFEAMGGPFHYLEGGPFTGPDDILVDDFLSQSKNVHAGDKLKVLNHEFLVSGVVEHGKGGRKFMPIGTVQDLIGAPGKVSMFYIKLDDPRNVDEVVASIKKVPGMENYYVLSLSEWLSLMTPSHLPGFKVFVDVVIGVSVCIGFIVIFQSMYTAVMERTREIGILKSLGATNLYIVNVVLRETILLAIAGIIAGAVLSFFLRLALVHHYPTIRIELTTEWMLRGAGIAMASALLGAIYPALKAARKDPIEALAYE